LVTFQNAGIVFFVSLLISVLMTPFSGRLAEWIGAIDHPDGDRKHHDCAVPRLGGIGITTGFLLPPLFLLPFGREVGGVLTGAFVIGIAGLLDDALQLRPVTKLLAQIAAATCFVFISGASLTSFGDLLGMGAIETGELAPWITIFCIVGVINAMNLCDGLDGLAAGFAAIACIFLAVLAVGQQNWLLLALLLALMGGTFGFLRYNTHPAHLFMGDVGSMMLGYGLAVLSVLMVQIPSSGMHAIAPVSIALILALPIVDTLLVMGRRLLQSKNPFIGDRTHLHHRLLALGLPHDQVVMLLYICMALFGCLALTVRSLPAWLQIACGAFVLLGLFSSLSLFERMQGRYRFRYPRQMFRMISVLAGRRWSWLRSRTRTISAVFVALIGLAVVVTPVPYAVATSMLYGVLFSVVLLYPWHPDREHVAVQKGVVYMMVTALFLTVHLRAPQWLQYYLAFLAVVALAIVCVRVASWSRQTRGPSSFQALILLNVALIPLIMVLLPLFDADEIDSVVVACLEAVPVAWLLNGYSAHIYRRNRHVTLMLMGLIVLILLRTEI